MAFNSIEFLLFFPIVVCLYFVIPKKVRYVWLLVMSYYFYMSWNIKYAGLLFLSTVVTYFSSRVINKIRTVEGRVGGGKNVADKIVLVICILFNMSILVFFKYYDFIFENVSLICSKVGVHFRYPHFDVLLPVGISFYTFQALGYIVDVYRGEVRAERNFLKYALFISFFPQLVAGPIERSKNLLHQIEKPTSFNINKVRYGLFTMAYGLFLKIVVADNIANVIDPILSDFYSNRGVVVAACVVLFAFQIYCDFHGYTQIAIGSAKVLGFELQENFHAPYLSKNIKEFWRNWHISLTSWFTDYLYIPLGGSRKGRIRKYLNTMIVFLISGLWHGASWAFIVWGGINGIYLVIYDVTKNIRKKLRSCLNIDSTTFGWKVVTRMFTFFLVDYAWLYFRSGGLKLALKMQRHILYDFHIQYIFDDQFWAMFGSYTKLLIILFSIVIVMVVDCLQYVGINWKEHVLRQQLIYRWFIYLMILFIIFMYGVYGIGNGQTQFIYFQF